MPLSVAGEVRSNYQPHTGQLAFHQSKARFRSAACGRQFGKTLMGLADIGLNARKFPGSLWWWIDPTYKFAKRYYRDAKIAFRNSLKPKHEGYSDSELWLEFKNGARIEFHSAEIPDNLRGANPWGVYLNEASLMSFEVWEAIRPAISTRRARCSFFFTPKGRGHWTYVLWSKGMDAAMGYDRKGPLASYESWKFPTTANPFQDANEIEEARELMPRDSFEQEYLAEWKEDSAGVFKNVDRICCASPLAGPVDGVAYGAGIDLAKTQDFTVVSIFDLYRKVQVHLYRTQTLAYNLQEKIIMDLAFKWRLQKIMVDATGVGEPVCDALDAAFRQPQYPCPVNIVDRFKFTGDSKQALVESMVVDFEKDAVRLIDDETQKNELKSFQYVVTPSRKIKYSAPEGMHDDIVIADGLGMALTHDTRLWRPVNRMPAANARGWT